MMKILAIISCKNSDIVFSEVAIKIILKRLETTRQKIIGETELCFLCSK